MFVVLARSEATARRRLVTPGFVSKSWRFPFPSIDMVIASWTPFRIACGITAALLLAGCAANTGATASAPTSTRPSSLQVVRTVEIGSSAGVAALAAGAGKIWIALPASAPYMPGVPGTGRVVSFDELTGARRDSWTVAGDPLGIAVDGGFLWIAGGSGDHSVLLADPDSVVQLDTTSGAVVHRYSVVAPQAVAASGDTALVVAGGIGALPTTLLKLTQGQITTLGTVPGQLASNPGFSGPALAVCSSGTYVATLSEDSRFRVYQVTSQSVVGTPKWIIPGTGTASLACTADAVFLAVGGPDPGGVVRLSISTSAVAKPFGSHWVSDLAIVGGNVCSVDQAYGDGPGHVSLFGATTGLAGDRVQLPDGDARLMVAETSRVWVVAGNQLVELQT